MANHGTFDAFDPGKEDWTSYTEHLEQYFVANDVEDNNKQRAILLSVCGASTYQLIRNLATPNKPTEKSFGDIVKDHHHPQPSVIVERFNFNSQSQREGESAANSVAQLRKLSEHCQYGETLKDMIRDRLVCGLRDTKLQRRLLVEPRLTFQKAFDLTLASEVAARSAKELQDGQRPTETPAVFTMQQREMRTKWQPRNTQECYRCGGRHQASTCRFKGVECHNCGKRGHIARVCQGKPCSDNDRTPWGKKCIKLVMALAKRNQTAMKVSTKTVPTRCSRCQVVATRHHRYASPCKSVRSSYRWKLTQERQPRSSVRKCTENCGQKIHLLSRTLRSTCAPTQENTWISLESLRSPWTTKARGTTFP